MNIDRNKTYCGSYRLYLLSSSKEIKFLFILLSDVPILVVEMFKHVTSLSIIPKYFSDLKS